MQTTLLPSLAHTYDSLTYLYRLRPGFTGTSHACHCARICGVPNSVVERADRIYRIGLREWHDSEAMKDEAIVRRLLGLELGGEENEQQQSIKRQVSEMSDEAAKKWIDWVLSGDDEVKEDEERPWAFVAGSERRGTAPAGSMREETAREGSVLAESSARAASVRVSQPAGEESQIRASTR